MSIAYFANGNYPSHDIKWINYLSESLNINAIVFLREDSEVKHFTSRVKVFPVLKSMPLLNPFARWKLVKRYKSILDLHQVQLVHFLGGELKCQYGSFFKLPFIITTRGTDILEQLPRKYMNLQFSFSKQYLSFKMGSYFHEKAYKKASIVTSTSYEQMYAVKRFQPKVRRQALIRTGSFVEQFFRSNIEHSGRLLRLFSPRTMKSICNQDIILKAFAEYLKIESQAMLYMVDNLPDGKWSKEVIRTAEHLGIMNKVKFLPQLSREEMASQYKEADVTIMIPKSDGTPVSAIECMLTGSPLVLGKYQYDHDLFNEETVWQLDETNEAVLLDALLTLREEIKNGQVIKKLRQAQLVASELADTRKEMQRLKDVYREVLTDN